ncbi:conserved hypothetical protein [Paecilomyces variotii No. 5]|uniref:Up-regulated during septation protein 1 domain-containing protein n=1 Tax=Byssochlamys spectabilis (strain No. 5 / NBRC 109023) TaxID=1356009 RepID=V5FUR6_BYSSN|nr:conserved hypothetical protein [Paecilomyces variotii No. 5]
MNPLVQDEGDSNVSIGLNNILAKEIYSVTETKDRESNGQAISPTQAEKPKFQLWPTIKKQGPLPGRNPVEAVRPRLLASSHSSPSLRDSGLLVSSKRLKQLKEASGTRRRKISFPDLGFGPMTTVQEHYADSPTVPGRFPVHERSNSAPSWGRTPFEESMLEPVSEPMVLVSEQGGSPLRDQIHQANVKEHAEKNISGPKDSNRAKQDTQPDMPPAVPPKSPRMARTPQSTQVLTSKFSPSSPKAHTTPQANRPPSSRGGTPVNPSSGPSSPKHITAQVQRSQSRQRADSSLERQRSNDRKPSISIETVHRHKRDGSGGLPGLMGTITELSNVARNEYIRDLSQTPIMERGRPPMKNGFVERKNSKRQPSEDSSAPSSLPLGVAPPEALRVLTSKEVERLQEQARRQAQKFEVLKYNDVKSLSQELRALDERCDYLRTTHNSLRAGRRSLHERMITYLKSPSLSKYSMDSMLRQEEALASLDQAIDEWVAKLEVAENRRTRVRQKLLEHMAATLLVQRTNPEPQRFEESPPPSPDEIETEVGTSRKDVHSIKIYADEMVYADAKVYALFADIEKEMELMTEARNDSSARDDTP